MDVVSGLGVPVSRLVLTTPAMGHSFSLMDPAVNLPGAATTGLPATITYQQVPCHHPHHLDRGDNGKLLIGFDMKRFRAVFIIT